MVDPVEFLLSFVSFLEHVFHVVTKAFSMSLCTSPPAHASPPPPPPPPLSWKRLAEPQDTASKRLKEASSDRRVHPAVEEPTTIERVSPPEVAVPIRGGWKCESFEGRGGGERRAMAKVREEKAPRRMRKKRPAKLVIPEACVSSEFAEACKERDASEKEMEVEGGEFSLAGRRGRRHVMEDGYGVITHVHGDSKQAFFGVFDGHGGRAAVDFVSENLGKNIIAALADLDKEENQLELAIRAGYLATDREFLSQGVSSGVCTATALIKDGELHVANVGDCRVVLCRQGVAKALTRDHRAGREDERIRIESSGGYVNCRNGVWRVSDSLAVSRAIGDINMKEWIISEPETNRLRLTPDCEFLIVASDGLWDKVTDQEAVDVVSRHKNTLKSCKDLMDISCSRGNRDDITVMVVDLQRFV